MAETLSKFNYNQYLVDKRGWSENELVNFTNKSNYAPKVIKKGPLTLREYVPRRLITLREDLYESFPCRRDSHDLLRQQSENVKLRRPGWPETQFHEEFHENWNSMIFSIFFNNFLHFSIFFNILMSFFGFCIKFPARGWSQTPRA